MTAKCIAQWKTKEEEEIAIALERLPFGSMPAPAEFSICSDITFDLARDLMECESRDPEELASPLKEEIPPPVRLPDNIPFGTAMETDLHLPPEWKGGTDGYTPSTVVPKISRRENFIMCKVASNRTIPFEC